jgi:hypothetical protein
MGGRPPRVAALRVSTVLLALAVWLIASGHPLAQRRYGGLPGAAKAFSANNKYDGRFRFVRLTFNCSAFVGSGCFYYRNEAAWEHGYPLAEQNLMQIMEAITALDPHVEDSEVLSIEDPELMKYPVSYMTEAGYWITTDKEAATFREYLLKGGFVIFDDFRDPPRGGGGWANMESNMSRVIPGGQWVNMSVDDPIFHSFFDITSLASLQQHYGETTAPQFGGLYLDNDPHKRLLAIANYNVDISDWWEYAGQGYTPVDMTNEAYKFGVNYIIYGLTH